MFEVEVVRKGDEVYVTCPYNKAHCLLKDRIQFHLTRCGAQHAGSLRYDVCPFNATHIIPRDEMDAHQVICPSRITLDNFLTSTQHCNPPPGVLEVKNHDAFLPPSDEDWNEDLTPGPSIVDVLKETVKDKPVLIQKSGGSKSVRRAHRMEERRRIQEVMTGQTKSNYDAQDIRLPYSANKPIQNKTENEAVPSTSDKKLPDFKPAPIPSKNPWSKAGPSTGQVNAPAPKSLTKITDTETVEKLTNSFARVTAGRGRGFSRAPRNDVPSSTLDQNNFCSQPYSYDSGAYPQLP